MVVVVYGRGIEGEETRNERHVGVGEESKN